MLYRDLDVVQHWTRQAEQGLFEVDDLLGYLAGFSTYAVVGELALGRQLAGSALPKPGFPGQLKLSASRNRRWRAAFHRDCAKQHDIRGDRPRGRRISLDRAWMILIGAARCEICCDAVLLR